MVTKSNIFYVLLLLLRHVRIYGFGVRSGEGCAPFFILLKKCVVSVWCKSAIYRWADTFTATLTA